MKKKKKIKSDISIKKKNQTSKTDPNRNFIEEKKACKVSLWMDLANIKETKAVYY